jgi:tetratricopeptide (TPR) repeat protein
LRARIALAALLTPFFAQCATSTTAVVVEPREAIAGEATYRAQPASYWIERVRAELPSGNDDGLDALGALVSHDEAVDREVLRLLRDRDEDVREETAEALRRSVVPLPEPIVDELVRMLNDAHHDAAYEAVTALTYSEERYGEAIPAFRRALAGEPPALRRDLVERLNELAWDYADPDNPNPRGYAVAVPLARAGVALSAGKDRAILDTLAWALHADGQRDEALKTAARAVAFDPDKYSMEHYERMRDE